MSKKKAALITVGQSAPGKFADIAGAMPHVELIQKGILDGMTLNQVQADAWPKEGEGFIVSNLASGEQVRVEEGKALAWVNRCLLEARDEGCEGAMILCTGHFDPPQLPFPLLVPERVIPAVLNALGVKRLGAIVPEPEQIADSLAYYKSFDPIIYASSPYGAKEELRETAARFRDEPVDLILTDCMGFDREMGQIVAAASAKRVFVPRVMVPAMLGALML